MRSDMTKEKQRLIDMLKENKISEADYKLLSAVIDKKPSRFSSIFSLCFNPFQKIAGFYALISGLMIIIGMSYLGKIGKFYSIGIVGCLNASVIKNPKVAPTFFLLLYQNLIVWLVVAFLFIMFAKIFQKKRLRLVDFFGTVALARFPFLILMIFLVIMRFASPSSMNIDLAKGLPLHPSIFMSLLSAVVILCFIWEIVTYFYALAESSGLVGKKLWVSFILALIFGEIITSPLSMIFF